MATTNATQIKSGMKRAANKAAYNPVMEALARVGYGVRGLIYIMMGFLSLSVALGKGGTVTDQQGAIAAIGRQPAGLVLLWVVLVGLVSYAIWGVIRAVLDPLQKGHDLKGVIARLAYVFSAVSYAILVLPTYGFITGAGSAQSGANTQESLAMILSKSWGHMAVAAIGVIVIAAGLYQVYQGFNSSFDKQFQSYAMTAREVKWATQLGRFGTASRGLIIAVVGFLLFQVGIQTGTADQAVGIDAALLTLQRQPYGIWLLGIVALGLIAFGLFSAMSGIWFRSKR
jgi:hypothetical protein